MASKSLNISENCISKYRKTNFGIVCCYQLINYASPILRIGLSPRPKAGMSTFWAVFAPIPTGRERSPMRMPRTGTFRAVFAPVPRVEGMDGHVSGGFCARPHRQRAIPYANGKDAHVLGGFCTLPPGGGQGRARFGRFSCLTAWTMAGASTSRAVFVPIPTG